MLSDKETKKKIFELTLAVYRVTNLFPKDEASVHRIRERANEILEDVVFYSTIHDKEVTGKRDLLHNLEGKVQALLSLFKLARAQNFIKELNFDILEWEYDRILELVDLALKESKEKVLEVAMRKITSGIIPKESLGGELSKLNERQRQMLGFFKNNGNAKLKEITKMFPGVSEKTIRNDLKVLRERELLKLNGRAPQSHYSLR